MQTLSRTAVIAAITAVVFLATGGAAFAQQPKAPPGGLETIQIRPNFYVIFGDGGNIAVQVGVDGVVLVDSGTADKADQVVAIIKKLTDKPIRYIINTSAEPDHFGGNEKIAAVGNAFVNLAQFAGAPAADVLAREEVSLRLSAADPPLPAGDMPTETWTMQTKSMYVNGDGIQMIHAPAAHADGDIVVFFRRVDVIVAGDIFDLRRFPFIDVANGGTIQGEIDALNRLLVLAIPPVPLTYKEDRTFIVPGHGRIADHAELVDYRDMLTVIRDVIESQIKKGMTLEQIQATNPTAGYRARYGADTGPWTTKMFVEAVYKSLMSGATH
jgi:glyoxylase-like metal-dependent hydrolase (beta-lactamase superfamily II)